MSTTPNVPAKAPPTQAAAASVLAATWVSVSSTTSAQSISLWVRLMVNHVCQSETCLRQ